jgi:excisionase family DNA binding protein
MAHIHANVCHLTPHHTTRQREPSVNQMTPIFVSVKEAARILGLGTWSVYKLLDDQLIASQYQGRKRLVRVDSLREYADSLPTEAPKPEPAA